MSNIQSIFKLLKNWGIIHYTIKFTLLMYKSVVFRIFTKLCNNDHYLIPEHFFSPKENLYISSHSPFSPLPTNLIFLSRFCLFGALWDLLWLDLGCFHFLVITKKKLYEYSCVNFCVDIFISLVYIPKSGIAGLYGNSIYDFLRNCQTVFESDGNILRSHQ